MSDTEQLEVIQDSETETFTATDGNNNVLDDCRYPGENEPTDFIYDADGIELHKGDYVLVLECAWPNFVNKIVKVTSVSRGSLRTGGGARPTREIVKAWSPTSPLNGVGIQYRNRSTGVRWDQVRRVDLTEEAGMRLLLADLYDERSQVDIQLATVQHQHVMLSLRIADLLRSLAEA